MKVWWMLEELWGDGRIWKNVEFGCLSVYKEFFVLPTITIYRHEFVSANYVVMVVWGYWRVGIKKECFF